MVVACSGKTEKTKRIGKTSICFLLSGGHRSIERPSSTLLGTRRIIIRQHNTILRWRTVSGAGYGVLFAAIGAETGLVGAGVVGGGVTAVFDMLER